jgi:methylase of polypeptide subunit release factors
MAARQLIIAANLPYLTKAQIKTSPSIQREPKLALDGGAAGLKYYQELFKQLSILHLVASPITLLCEIDPGQKTSFRTLVKKYWSGASLNLQRDLAGRYRLAQITLEH